MTQQTEQSEAPSATQPIPKPPSAAENPPYQHDKQYDHETMKTDDHLRDVEHTQEVERSAGRVFQADRKHEVTQGRKNQELHEVDFKHETELTQDGTHEVKEKRETERAPGYVHKEEHKRELDNANNGEEAHAKEFHHEVDNTRERVLEVERKEEVERNADRVYSNQEKRETEEMKDKNERRETELKRETEQTKDKVRERDEKREIEHTADGGVRRTEHKHVVRKDLEGTSMSEVNFDRVAEVGPGATREQVESHTVKKSNDTTVEQEKKHEVERMFDVDQTHEKDYQHKTETAPGHHVDHTVTKDVVRDPNHEKEAEVVRDVERTPKHIYTHVTKTQHEVQKIDDTSAPDKTETSQPNSSSAASRDVTKDTKDSNESKGLVVLNDPAIAPAVWPGEEVPAMKEEQKPAPFDIFAPVPKNEEVKKKELPPAFAVPVETRNLATNDQAPRRGLDDQDRSDGGRTRTDSGARRQQHSKKKGGEDFAVRHIPHAGETISIAMQNENGPCPIIALCNVLALKRRIRIPYRETRDGHAVSLADLLNLLASHIMKRTDAVISKSADREYTVEEALEVLPKFAQGMDINVKFDAPDDFEASREVAVVDATGVHILHGWIVDPEREAQVKSELQGNQGYNVMAARAVEGRAPAFAAWTKQTATQLTQAGIKALRQKVKEGQFYMFFRNNHYTVITAYNDTLYTLLTDEGFVGRADAVWQSLEDVDGAASHIVGANFGDNAKKPMTVPQADYASTSMVGAPPPPTIVQAIPVHAAQPPPPATQTAAPAPAPAPPATNTTTAPTATVPAAQPRPANVATSRPSVTHAPPAPAPTPAPAPVGYTNEHEDRKGHHAHHKDKAHHKEHPHDHNKKNCVVQ